MTDDTPEEARPMTLTATSAGWEENAETGAREYVVRLRADTPEDVPGLVADDIFKQTPLRLSRAADQDAAEARLREARDLLRRVDDAITLQELNGGFYQREDPDISHQLWSDVDAFLRSTPAPDTRGEDVAARLLDWMTHHHLPLSIFLEADSGSWVVVNNIDNTVLGSGETVQQALSRAALTERGS